MWNNNILMTQLERRSFFILFWLQCAIMCAGFNPTILTIIIYKTPSILLTPGVNSHKLIYWSIKYADYRIYTYISTKFTTMFQLLFEFLPLHQNMVEKRKMCMIWRWSLNNSVFHCSYVKLHNVSKICLWLKIYS